MRIEEERRRTLDESTVPMINVVFLLLIFFLMTAQIVPPAPFEVAPPVAESDQQAEAELVLYVGPEETVAFRDARGEAAVSRLVSLAEDRLAEDEAPPLTLRADGRAEARRIASLLSRLAAAGFSDISLVTAAS